MGFRELKKSVKVILIIGIVCSVTGSAIFLGWWFRPIKQIEIFDDKDFKRKYHLPGKGTEEDPYIIEGFNLADNSHHNVRILGVTKSFIIRNCIFEGSNKGIDLYGTYSGVVKIINNTFRNNDFGIMIRGYDGCLISNNTFIDNHEAIYGGRGSYVIEKNTITSINVDSDNWDKGIHFSSYNTIIRNNYFNAVGDSIWLDYSEDIIIRENSFTNCGYGVFINQGIDCIIENNTVCNSSSGIVTQHCKSISVKGNNCFNNSVKGIAIYSTIYGLVENNSCIGNGWFGLKLSIVYNSICQNNIFNNNNYSGIYTYGTIDSTINNNTCSDNGIGLSMYLTNSSISYNAFEHNLEYGIRACVSNSTIWNNNFINNNYQNNPEITSQAYVVANTTYYAGYPIWYNNDTQQGNYWSELTWFVGVEYTIDPGNHTDKYPLDDPIEIRI